MKIIPNTIELVTPNDERILLSFMGAMKGDAGAAGIDAGAGLAGGLASATGAEMVGFLQSGAGALLRTTRSKMRDILNVKDFGAIGNDIADDTVAIQAALAEAVASKRRLYVPAGIYKITAPLIANGRVYLQGEGSGAFAYGILALTQGSTFKAYHAGTLFEVVNANGGTVIEGMEFDCNSQAAFGLVLTSVVKGWFNDISIRAPTNEGLRMQCSNGANTMYCTFINLSVVSTNPGTKGIYITGATIPNQANTCHCVFIDTKVDYSGAGTIGIRIGNADNIVFYQTYIFCPETGSHLFGVDLSLENGNFPISIGFYHLQTSRYGMSIGAGVNDCYVYGYMQDNAQPPPTYNPALTRFYWTDATGRSSVTRSLQGLSSTPGGNNLAGEVAIGAAASTIAVLFPYGNEPNGNYQVFASPNWQTTVSPAARAGTGFTLNFGTPAPAGGGTCGWLIVRTG